MTPEERREKYAELEVTLDMRPAKIIGFCRSHGTIASLDNALVGQWSWQAIDRIVEKDKRFRLV